ncbi:MAG: hypothetical protein KDA89_14500, partial [Planctomycetaceae bacterium]|nr:hypothetical protein [Planctomycetaceae bacterium]
MIRSFLQHLRLTLSRRARTSAKLKKRVHHLRLRSLEDRRVLNASLALVTGVEMSGGETLNIHDGGMQDLGLGDVQSVDLVLDSGTWTVDAALDVNRFELSADMKTLSLDHSLFDDGSPILTASHAFLIQGDAATTDALVIDLTNLDFVPSGGISFAGGESDGDNDSLTVMGYDVTVLNLTHNAETDIDGNPIASESGSLDLTLLGTISFTEIEPLALAGNAADLIINLPAGADATVVLSDDGTANDNVSQIDGLFEVTTFTNPTSSLTINDGTGVKSISVEGLDAMFAADVSILEDDATPDNAVTFQTNDTETGGGDLTVEADTIAVNAAITTAGGFVDFDAETSITSTADGDITTSGDAIGEDSGDV